MEMNGIDYGLRCSIQRALLGEIDERVIAVTCGVAGSTIRIRFYVDGPSTERDLERIRCVATEVMTDFLDEGLTVHEECAAMPVGKPENLGFWAFYRAERQ